MTDYSKGVQVGGDNGFDIQQGGNIINSFDVVSGTTFNEGGVIELVAASGKVQQSTDVTSRLAGLTNTRKQSDFFNNQTLGSGKAGMVMDVAVVNTIELASGATFQPNSKVYNNGDGTWDSNAGTDTRVYGIALNSAVANNGDTLNMLYLGAQPPA
jgi:hypothetical protein